MTTSSHPQKTVSTCRLVLRSVISHSVLFAFLFVPAGRWNYWQGWLFMGLTICVSISILFLFRDKKDLLQERIKPGPGMKWWDKIFLVFFLPFFYATIITSSWDSGRCGWSGIIPIWLYGLGYVFYFVGLGVFLWSMWINRFFSGVVRIQDDRGHVVIDNGPYAYVRHPGYVGLFFMIYGIPLCLGSFYGLIPSLCVTAILLIRTRLEDATLQAELPGYKEYAERVRWKLVRGVW